MPYYVTWTEDAIHVIHVGASDLVGREKSRPVEAVDVLRRRMPAGYRYQIGLARRPDGAIWFRSMDGGRTLIETISRDGEMQALPDWPNELASLPPQRLTLFRDCVAARPAEDSAVVLWRAGAGAEDRPFPRGFHAQSVARDPGGVLWAAGSDEHDSGVRPAVWRSGDDGKSWEAMDVVTAGLGAALHGWTHEKNGAYRSVAALAKHLVLARESGEEGHESTFLSVRHEANARFREKVIHGDVYRTAVERDDGVLIVFVHGHAVHVSDEGRWRREDLAARVCGLLEDEHWVPQKRLGPLILAADAEAGSRLLLLISIKSSQGQRIGEVLLVLDADRGEVLARSSATQPEIVAACWAPGER